MTIDLAKLRAETLALIDGTTPGPWVEGQEGNARVYGPDGMGAHSGLVASFCRRADARLIAAAPTLAVNTLPLLDEIERLRTALAPFARLADAYDPPEHDDHERCWGRCVPTLGDLRKARAALAEGDPA